MTRTQVQFETRQYQRLKELAARRGISMAQLVREAVDGVLARQGESDRWEDLFSVVRKHADESGEPVGRDHDRYLDEAYGGWREST